MDRQSPAEPNDSTLVTFEDLEAIEAHLVDAYEAAHGVADAGLADWEDLGEPIALALTIVKRILAEGAA